MPRASWIAMTIALVACERSETRTCIGRGATTRFEGSATYSGQTPSKPLAGSESFAIDVDDWTAACPFENMAFTIHVGACVLWFDLEGTNEIADAEPRQTCVLHVGDQDVELGIALGRFSSGEMGRQLFLEGDVAGGGHLQWTFTGR